MKKPSLIRISKEFTFEMAHALFLHDGKCSSVHGHSYKLTVTIIGGINNQPTGPKQGMVMDFADLKKIVSLKVLEYFDHSLVLNAGDPLVKKTGDWSTRPVITDYQPTCENILLDIVNRIKPEIQAPLKLQQATLRETGSSYAEWLSSDNE